MKHGQVKQLTFSGGVAISTGHIILGPGARPSSFRCLMFTKHKPYQDRLTKTERFESKGCNSVRHPMCLAQQVDGEPSDSLNTNVALDGSIFEDAELGVAVYAWTQDTFCKFVYHTWPQLANLPAERSISQQPGCVIWTAFWPLIMPRTYFLHFEASAVQL